MRTYLEREDKWDIDNDVAVPSFDDDEAHTDTLELTNTYYDTADLDLLSHDVTLRFREGDENEHGWQVKIPAAGEARTELSVDAPSVDVPDEVKNLLFGLRLGKDLTVAAIIHTRRTRHRHLDNTGQLRFEIADDTVSATIPGPVATATTWREIEVELGPETASVPKLVRKRLIKAGASPSAASSKLARALGHIGSDGESSGTAVDTYLREQIAAVFAGDLALRSGDDAIHATRVALRRLRSTLRTGVDLLDSDQIAGADTELRWFAGLLGEVRDRQVLRARFAKVLAELPGELKLGPVAARIEDELLTEQKEHQAIVGEAMSTDRYRQLLALLAGWNETPPVVSGEAGAKRVRMVASGAARKADKRLATALESGNAGDLHTARKAAKRARYAGELATPVLSKKHGGQQVKRYKKIQTVLGEHQDATVAAEALWHLGARAGVRDGENGFTYGVLYQRELDAASAAREHAATLKH